MSILGRRRASKPVEANSDGLELLRRQLTNPDPALRLLGPHPHSWGQKRGSWYRSTFPAGSHH
jgi:hypothetical protein